jgi:hypothetical protein
MIYEMNNGNLKFCINFIFAKFNVKKIVMISIVVMLGILMIPTNVHDAKAKPCS